MSPSLGKENQMAQAPIDPPPQDSLLFKVAEALFLVDNNDDVMIWLQATKSQKERYERMAIVALTIALKEPLLDDTHKGKYL